MTHPPAPCPPFRRPPLPAAPYLIAGLARAGGAALARLGALVPAGRLHVWDANGSRAMQARAGRWRRMGVEVTLGGDGTAALAALGPAGTVVKSPGIAPDAPLLRAARAAGLTVVDELEIGWRLGHVPVIAVTGTNGKSTTCAAIAAILAAAGRTAPVAGNTEFGPPLSAALDDDAGAVVCEVSSFQLEGATAFRPEIAVFTNLTPEHLPHHGGMEAYGAAKRRMFLSGDGPCGTAVVNADDPWGRRIGAAVAGAGGRVVTYGFSADADLRLTGARWTLDEAVVSLRAGGRAFDLRSRLPGRHNALNLAAAVAAAQAFGVPEEAIAAGIAALEPPPGRFRRILGLSPQDGRAFDVVVDYAHTPDGIDQILDALRSVTRARGSALHTVFGAVGLPDPTKAAGCGAAARRGSDRLILTTGSAPRSARVPRLGELRDAALPFGPVELVLDRRRAIARALGLARPGDVVAVLGLGALRHQVLDARGAYAPFEDAAAVAALLREKRS